MRDGWRRFFPAMDLPGIPGQSDWAGEALDRLGESPLQRVALDQPLVVRLLCLPMWRPACAVRVEDNGLTWWLAGAELTGEEAGCELGELGRHESRRLTIRETDRVVGLWAGLGFWSLAASAEDYVFDGTTYVVEAAERGRYRVVTRSDPAPGDPFGEFCDVLVRLACLALR
jgi:hypothetical protein